MRVHAVRGERGLTLLEVVIALLILAVAVLAVAGLQASSLRATRTSHVVQELNGAARAELEAWRAAKILYTAPSTSACAVEAGLDCQVELRPCAIAGNGLDCGAGSVPEPAAHAITVTVSRDDSDVTLSTIVLNL